MKGTLTKYGGIALASILLLILALGLFFAYNWFTANYGDTAQRAVQEYFTALGDGEYERMYDLTPDASLTDPFGRKISRTDFATQVRSLTGGKALTISQTLVEVIGQKNGAYYFKLTLFYEIGGVSKSRPILIEAVQESGEWKVTYPFISAF